MKNKIKLTLFILILMLISSCSVMSKYNLENYEVAGVQVKNALKIEGVKHERGLIYVYDVRFPWMKLKYYCKLYPVAINFTLDGMSFSIKDWHKIAAGDANYWSKFNAYYSIRSCQEGIEVNGVFTPIFECSNDDEPGSAFYFVSIPDKYNLIRVIASVYSVDRNLKDIDRKLRPEEIRAALFELIESKEWKNKVKLIDGH